MWPQRDRDLSKVQDTPTVDHDPCAVYDAGYVRPRTPPVLTLPHQPTLAHPLHAPNSRSVAHTDKVAKCERLDIKLRTG